MSEGILLLENLHLVSGFGNKDQTSHFALSHARV